MEPPSRQLSDLLTRLRLASAGDLRRCRTLVRRLARDLPTFDSVWIDALTQTRVLTPFQARLLESEHPEHLEVGPCILVDEWERDARWSLCLARHRGTKRKCLLTFLRVPDETLTRARDSVRDLIAGLRGLSHSSIVVPQGCDEHDGRLVVVSPFTSGPTLQQLLVRRGRFPISIVTEIARQLCDALAALEGSGVVHGDLRLKSVRLTSRGQAILLNPGVLPAMGGRVSFHDGQPAESYDGTAPELISTGRVATYQSDLYALGCLLWQLLAGRPPFPTGDPLGKLAAHQSKTIDDVRRWRPDTPPELATLIVRLTQKDPDLRPSGAKEVRDAGRIGPRTGRAGLAKFHASFGQVAPRPGDSHRSASKFPWPVAASLMFVLGGLSLSLLDAGARNELLRLAIQVSEPAVASTAPTTVTSAMNADDRLPPFPSDPVNGVIEIQSDGPFSATEIRTDRPLTIRAAAGTSPTVIVARQPMRIIAQSLQIDGIRFVSAEATTSDPAAESDTITSSLLLAIQAQQVSIDHCGFEWTATDGPGTAVAWRIADEADPTGGRFVARNTTYRGAIRALDLYAMPRVIGFDNCLKHGDGALVKLTSTNRSIPLRLHLRQSTLRDAGPVIQWTKDAAAEGPQPALIVVENSVCSLADAAGVLKFVDVAPAGWERLLQITGEGSLLSPNTPIAVSQGSPLDAPQLRVEGLIIDDFEFAADDDSPGASVVIATQAPRSTTTPPGIDPTRFATPLESPVVRQASHEYNAQ